MLKRILLGMLLFQAVSAGAQTQPRTEKEYARSPLWIAMMDIEGVNYAEVIKAFTIYWEHHEMPEEEGDRAFNRKEKKQISRKELNEIRKGAAMRFQVKKFEHWKIMNGPFVKEDGTVMTAEERLASYKNH